MADFEAKPWFRNVENEGHWTPGETYSLELYLPNWTDESEEGIWAGWNPYTQTCDYPCRFLTAGTGLLRGNEEPEPVCAWDLPISGNAYPANYLYLTSAETVEDQAMFGHMSLTQTANLGDGWYRFEFTVPDDIPSGKYYLKIASYEYAWDFI